MSCSSAIPASPELEQAFQNAGESTRFFVVRIENEVLVLHGRGDLTGSLQNDWNGIAREVGAKGACYVLVRVGGAKQWLTITFVPEGTKVKDKMVYASTKATLQRHLGFQNFTEELHANSIEELSYDFWQGSKKPVHSLSKFEETRIEVIQQEDNERGFRDQLAQQQKSIRSSGGYHAVTMLFSPSAVDMVSQYSSGSANFVELKINDKKDGVDGVKAENVSASALGSKLTTSEPRFYLYKYQAKNLFLYVCPGAAPRQLRMVYSTAKPSVSQQVEHSGVKITKNAELADAADCDEPYLNSLFSRASYAPGAFSKPAAVDDRPDWMIKLEEKKGGGASSLGVRPAAGSRPKSVVVGAHPIYGLMSQDPKRPVSKKIVIPPSGAW